MYTLIFFLLCLSTLLLYMLPDDLSVVNDE